MIPAANRFTSESVTEGHPDKICDRVSDAILDEILAVDPDARVAVETVVTTGLVNVVGEISTSAYVDIPGIVRREVNAIGYTSSDVGFDGDSCGVQVSIDQQSPDIAAGVTTSRERRTGQGSAAGDAIGAGDQGLMFGYACDDTPELMPLPVWLAHRLAERLAQVRKDGIVTGLRPDGKTQVTIDYEGSQPRHLATVVISAQHHPALSFEDLEGLLNEYVINPVLREHATSIEVGDHEVVINSTGSFVVGGPQGDAGLTGRKIIVDTYGGMARHGGGAFSGKDPSKVDRSASYALRWVAKNVVAAGLARRCEVQVAYAIGMARPVGLYAETFGTEQVPTEHIRQAIAAVFDLRPAALIAELDLLRPIYRATSAYGHFGREHEDFTWERCNRTAELRLAAGLPPRVMSNEAASDATQQIRSEVGDTGAAR